MIVLETLGRRWFALGFIAILIWAAMPEGGELRGLRFLAISALVAFAAEYSSTHTGFPYGRYDYTGATRGHELYLSNVPLFVPLSFGVVVWAGRAMALGTPAARSTAGLALAGAIFATLIDFAADPMTLRGSTWFMGDLYRYRSGGWWFGVPWSNFAGWVLVSGIIIGIDDALGRVRSEQAGRRGVSLALVVCAFFTVVALATHFWLIAVSAASIAAALATIGVRRVGA